jgi:hypothetical protein
VHFINGEQKPFELSKRHVFYSLLLCFGACCPGRSCLVSRWRLSITVAGMCSCRLYRAGMRFCRVTVRAGIRFHGNQSRRPAKTMTARASAGSPSDCIKVAGVVQVPKINKWHNIYSLRLWGLNIKLSGLPRQLHIPAVVHRLLLFYSINSYFYQQG